MYVAINNCFWNTRDAYFIVILFKNERGSKQTNLISGYMGEGLFIAISIAPTTLSPDEGS